MLKNLIVMEEQKYECDTKEELVKLLLGSDYYDKTEQEKRKTMELKAEINRSVAIMNGEWDEQKDFILKDETTYILSLLRLNKILLLEKKDCNIFTKNIDKSQIKENYIIVNNWADKLLEQI